MWHSAPVVLALFILPAIAAGAVALPGAPDVALSASAPAIDLEDAVENVAGVDVAPPSHYERHEHAEAPDEGSEPERPEEPGDDDRDSSSSGSPVGAITDAVDELAATTLPLLPLPAVDLSLPTDDGGSSAPAAAAPPAVPPRDAVEVAAEVATDPAVQASVIAVGVAAHLAPAAVAARPRLRIFPLFPLYSRIEDRDVLDHEGRARIYAILQQEPGQSIEALCEHTGYARSTVRHHVRVLHDAGIVHFDRVGRERLHFPAGRRDQAVAERLLEEPNRAAIMNALSKGPATLTELADVIGGSPSKAHFHLRRLCTAGLVDKAGERPHYVRTDAAAE